MVDAVTTHLVRVVVEFAPHRGPKQPSWHVSCFTVMLAVPLLQHQVLQGKQVLCVASGRGARTEPRAGAYSNTT